MKLSEEIRLEVENEAMDIEYVVTANNFEVAMLIISGVAVQVQL